jgi:hypothetical protein
LVDPRTQAIRYVGWTYDLDYRIRKHLSLARRNKLTYVYRWIRGLLLLQLAPLVVQLESGCGDFKAAERKWIAHYIAQGAPLTNLTSGGDGFRDLAAESRQRMSAAKKGKPLPARHADKISKALKGKPWSKRRRESQARVTWSGWTPEKRLAASKKHQGHPVSQAARAKLRKAHTGRRLPAEHCAKLSEAQTKRWAKLRSAE